MGDCGIAAVYLFDNEREIGERNAVPYLHSMLLQLQHRGQKSAGITTYNPDRRIRIESHRGFGRVNEVFREGNREENEKIIQDLEGIAGIGHVRYATSGERNDIGAERYAIQPFESHGNLLSWDWFTFAFNGNISNNVELEKEFEEKGYYFPYKTDTELIRRWLRIEHTNSKSKPNLASLFSEFNKKFDGSYSMVFLNGDGDLAIVRDPKGIMPLCYGVNEELFAAASESIALEKIGIKKSEIQDVLPGEIIAISNNELKIGRFAEKEQTFQNHRFAQRHQDCHSFGLEIGNRSSAKLKTARPFSVLHRFRHQYHHHRA